MEIQKLTVDDKELIEQCDKLLIEFLNEEAIYDTNLTKSKNTNSLLVDIANQNNILLIAKENEEVLGFLFGYIEKNNKNIQEVAHLSFIYVKNKYRNNKIATKLIDEFISFIKKENIEIIEVKCYKNNEIANKLYIKYGFDILWSNYRKKI